MLGQCVGIPSRLIKVLKFRNQGLIFSYFSGTHFLLMENTCNKPNASHILHSTGAKL